MEPIRVLIVDDSAFMRKMLTNILESDPRVQVVGTARNGQEGIKKLKQLHPDVVTMDVNMPIMDGISALKEIMETNPLPVIMLASESGTCTKNTIQAFEYGAVDFIMKPSGEISLDIETKKEEIITKVIAAKEATLTPGTLSEKRASPSIEHGRTRQKTSRKPKKQTLIAIGTSTGGPRALQRVLIDLPADFDIPILVVQHMPPTFTKSLADRLNALTNLHVKEATDGEKVEKGKVYIAPGDYHMKVKMNGNNYILKLTKDKPLNNHRPSVDALFYSIAELSEANKIAIVLTGMGSDGSEGLRKIKQEDEDALIIAEAEETSVIYGMPRAARDTGLADKILPLYEIGPFLKSLQANNMSKQ